MSSSGGQLEVIVGCMFSGKSEELIRRLRRARIARQSIFVVKPEIDSRSRNCLQSHVRSEFPAYEVASAQDIPPMVPPGTEVVGIDEAQFLGPDLVDVCRTLIGKRMRVIVAGLDLDYRVQPFGPMPGLLALADKVDKLTAVCTVCGQPATRSFRVGDGVAQIQIGAADQYEARCHDHYYGFRTE